MGCGGSKSADAVASPAATAKPASPVPPPAAAATVEKQSPVKTESPPEQPTAALSSSAVAAVGAATPVAPPSDDADETATQQSATPAVFDPNTAIVISPHAGFVIKSRNTRSSGKLFVNVMHHKSVKLGDKFLLQDAKWSTDKKGEQCQVFGVVVPTQTLKQCSEDEDHQYETSLLILNQLNATYQTAMIDLDFKLPKIQRGFMGDTLEDITFVPANIITDKSEPRTQPTAAATAASTAATAASTAATAATTVAAAPEPAAKVSEPAEDNTAIPSVAVAAATGTATTAPAPTTLAPSTATSTAATSTTAAATVAPAVMKGWLNKEGHVRRNWKTRYFVLQDGIISYYVEAIDEKPFGKNLKGQLCLAGYKILTLEAAEKRRMSTGRSSSSASSKDDAADGTNCRITLLYDAEHAKKLELVVETAAAPPRRTSIFGGGSSSGSKEKTFEELHLDAATVEEKQQWVDAIVAHTRYIEAKKGSVKLEAVASTEEDDAAAEEAAVVAPTVVSAVVPEAAAATPAVAVSEVEVAVAASEPEPAAEVAAVVPEPAVESTAASEPEPVVAAAAEEPAAAEPAAPAVEEETAPAETEAAVAAEPAEPTAAVEEAAESVTVPAAVEAESKDEEPAPTPEPAGTAITAAAEVNLDADDDGEGEDTTAAPPRIGNRTVSITTMSLAKDASRFTSLAKAGEEIVFTGLTGKPNPMGIQWMRELILVKPKRLVYCDVKSLTQKGEILWKSEPYPRVTLVNESTFDLTDAKGKTYRFIPKDSFTAQEWVDKINSLDPK